MAEYIDREALLKAMHSFHSSPIFIGHKTDEDVMFDKMVGIATEQPSADVVEVRRCKDCKHWMKDVAGCTDFVGRCEWANYMVGANGYCVYGEKMDGKERDDGNL